MIQTSALIPYQLFVWMIFVHVFFSIRFLHVFFLMLYSGRQTTTRGFTATNWWQVYIRQLIPLQFNPFISLTKHIIHHLVSVIHLNYMPFTLYKLFKPKVLSFSGCIISWNINITAVPVIILYTLSQNSA